MKPENAVGLLREYASECMAIASTCLRYPENAEALLPHAAKLYYRADNVLEEMRESCSGGEQTEFQIGCELREICYRARNVCTLAKIKLESK